MHIFLCIKTGNKSIKLFYIVDSILIIIWTIIVLIFFEAIQHSARCIFDEQNIIQSQLAQIDSGSLTNQEITEIKININNNIIQMNECASQTLEIVDNMIYFMFTLFGYLILNFTTFIYLKLKNRQGSIFDIEFIINITSITLIAILKYKISYEYKSSTDENVSLEYSLLLQKINEDQYFGAVIAAGFSASIQIMRIILKLQISKTFGPLIKIFQLMIKNLIQFGIILALVMLMFIIFGRIMFNRLEDFRSYESSFKYLFNAALGNFDFTTFDAFTNNFRYYGYIYLVIYIILIAITLLNFLIAILSSTYEEYRNKSTGVYLNHVIYTRKRIHYDCYYSSLMYSYSPLNIIMLPILIFLALKKCRTLNAILMHILYSPVIIISTLMFIFISVICMPFSYLNSIVISFRRAFSKQINMPFCHILFFLITIILFGIPFLLIVITKDSIKFVISLFETNLKRKYIEEENEGIFEKIDSDFVQWFFNLLEREYSDCEEFISSNKVIKEIREQFEIIDKIADLLYCNSFLFHNNVENKKQNIKKISDPLFKKRVSIVLMNKGISESNQSSSFSQIIDNNITHKQKYKDSAIIFKKENNDSTENHIKFKKSESLKKLLKTHTSKYILKQYNLIKRFILLNSIDFEERGFTKRSSLIQNDSANKYFVPSFVGKSKGNKQINIKLLLSIILESIEKQEFEHNLSKKVFIKSVYSTSPASSIDSLSISQLCSRFSTLIAQPSDSKSEAPFSNRVLSKKLNILKLQNNYNCLKQFRNIQ